MQINKKLLTTALTALLLLSMVAAVAPAFAAVDTFAATATVSNANVGQVVLINVVDASQGGQLVVTWQTVAGVQLGNDTSYANPDGTAKLYIAMPAVAQGSYSLIVKDVQYGATRSVPITIDAKITVSPGSGLSGDSVTVTGTGFAAGKTIGIDFATILVTPTTAPVVSATGGFTAVIIVPTSIDGTYVVRANDTATVKNIAVTNFIVGPAITLSQTSGPTGTVVSITGRGFSTSVGMVTISVNGVTAPQVVQIYTTTAGTFAGQFIIPTLAAQSAYAIGYVVRAYDAGAVKEALSNFRVTLTTSIVATPVAAAPTNTITLTGTDFTHIAGTVTTITFNGVTVGTLLTTVAGTISGSITLPNLNAGYYNLVATDANLLTATISYQIAITALYLSPTSGPTGTSVSFTVFGFHSGLTANITMGNVVVKSTFTVGAGTGTFMIPTMPTGTYTVTITEDDGLTATTTFTVTAVSQIVANPSQAPSGSTVTLTATNFGDTTPLTFYIYNSTWGITLTVSPSALTNGTGYYQGTFTVGTWAVGIYTINANNTANTLNATTVFTVGNAVFIINTRATEYRQGDIISFKVTSSFDDSILITILDPEGTPAYIIITSGMFEQLGGLYVLSYSTNLVQSFLGATHATFHLPSDVPIGTWTWNATNIANLVTTGSFTVIQSISGAVTDINTKLDSINLTIVSVSNNVLTIKNGTATIQATLDELDASIVSINGKIVTLDSKIGQITTSITNLPSSLTSTIQTSISNGMATITTNLNTINTKLDSIDAVIGSIAGTVVTLDTSIGTITTTLDAINAKVISIDNNVATIITDVGVLQGTVDSMKGNVATITTEFGTLQADVTTTKDTTSGMSALIYVAVAFALIAAIAAVASILLMRKKIAS